MKKLRKALSSADDQDSSKIQEAVNLLTNAETLASPVASSSRMALPSPLLHDFGLASSTLPSHSHSIFSPPALRSAGHRDLRAESELPPTSASTGTFPSPLMLLAEASQTAKETSWTPVIVDPTLGVTEAARSTINFGLRLDLLTLNQGLQLITNSDSDAGANHQSYFADRWASRTKRDTDDPAYDPIALALVDAEGVAALADFFYKGPHTVASILDPLLHTPAFLHQHSHLLLSVVCLVAAQSMPHQATLTERLNQHVQKCLAHCFEKFYRSVEIIQAIELLILWPRATRNISEDPAPVWLAYINSLGQTLGIDTSDLKERSERVRGVGQAAIADPDVLSYEQRAFLKEDLGYAYEDEDTLWLCLR